MTDPLFEADDGTTPLDEDEAAGLRPSWVRTRDDLNEAERDNILEARRSIRSATIDDVLDDHWLRQLHRRMFGDVWTWGGRYRTSERNIGIDPTQISVAVRSLADDCRWWIEHDPPDIVVARFHHRLVAIHPFPNGNGRHARAAADYLAQALDTDPPTWGATTGAPGSELRFAYLTGLRAADRGGDDLDHLSPSCGRRADPPRRIQSPTPTTATHRCGTGFSQAGRRRTLRCLRRSAFAR